MKDPSIFGITLKEIRNSLLSKIASDNNISNCLLEARKIESQIKQRKLFGIKTNVSYDAVGTYSRNKRYRSKGQGKG